MKITVSSAWMFANEFKAAGRDYFSMDGYETLLDYYDSIDENMECDAIAICCDWNEYGENCTLSFDDMLSDYGYLLDDEMENNEFDEKLDCIADELENRTTIIKLDNGNYLIAVF